MIAQALREESALWTAAVVLFAAGVGSDVLVGLASGARPLWVLLQLGLMAAMVASGGWLWQRVAATAAQQDAALRAAGDEIAQLRQQAAARQSVIAITQQQLRQQKAETARLRAQAASGLCAVIDAQFADWSLSSAEAEVAMLLVKGLSLKEVAGVRGTSERTTRKQAQATYRKAGLSGRAELSAFFLEDLLAPCA